MAVPVSTEAGSSVGSPPPPFDAQKLNMFLGSVLPDGRQFVVMRGEEGSDETCRIAVALNFSCELVKNMNSAK